MYAHMCTYIFLTWAMTGPWPGPRGPLPHVCRHIGESLQMLCAIIDGEIGVSDAQTEKNENAHTHTHN